MNKNYIRIFGVRIDLVDINKTLKLCDEYIKSRKVHQLVVVNVAKLIKAKKDEFLFDIIENADLVGADGVPLIWVSKLFGIRIPGRVNGTDLMEKLVERSSKKGYRLYFFGAEKHIVEKIVNIYQTQYPYLKIAGYRNGYFKKEQESKIARDIGKSNADILFVGFGSPKKETFIKKYKNIMNVPLIHGVGGSFDVIAGKTKRAPHWMQKCGLEWFYRILLEPKRMWKRYLVTNTLFIIYIIMELLNLKKFD